MPLSLCEEDSFYRKRVHEMVHKTEDHGKYSNVRLDKQTLLVNTNN